MKDIWPATSEQKRKANRSSSVRNSTSPELATALSGDAVSSLENATLAPASLAVTEGEAGWNAFVTASAGDEEVFQDLVGPTTLDSESRNLTIHVEISHTDALVESYDLPLSRAVLATFIEELSYHCLGAEQAYTAIVMALSERKSDRARSSMQVQKVFVQIDAFLLHAAMISQILMLDGNVQGPERAESTEDIAQVMASFRAERGAQLRQVLGPEVSLLQDLKLRDYFFDQDAQIDAWALTNAGEERVLLSMDIMQGPSDVIRSVAVRQLDPLTLKYWFCGDEFDLAAIAVMVSWITRTLRD